MVIRDVEREVWQNQESCHVILLSDSGSQFRRTEYQRFLHQNLLVCAMSAVGHCTDNTACEGFILFTQLRYRLHQPSYSMTRLPFFVEQELPLLLMRRFRKRILREFYQVTFMKKLDSSLNGLQVDLTNELSMKIAAPSGHNLLRQDATGNTRRRQ